MRKTVVAFHGGDKWRGMISKQETEAMKRADIAPGCVPRCGPGECPICDGFLPPFQRGSFKTRIY